MPRPKKNPTPDTPKTRSRPKQPKAEVFGPLDKPEYWAKAEAAHSVGKIPKNPSGAPDEVVESLMPIPDPDTGFLRLERYMLPMCDKLTACLWGFANHEDPLAREIYFWQCANMLWNHSGLPDKLYERNPWSERIIRECVREKYLAIGGAASSSKSHTLAGYGILRWLAQPAHVLVLFTSTTLREARKRVWGSVITLLSVVDGAPINIRDSIGSANYIDPEGRTFDRAGLSLIAAEKSRTREAVGKFIGLKQQTVVLIGDELSELSPAITHAALSNLSKNPVFEYKAASNPASPFDAFGDWASPKNGWESVDLGQAMEWRTKWGGKYIRLDGERSPNILARTDRYPYLPTQAKLDEDKILLGEKSRAYYRMVRAVFFHSDEDDGIYNAADLFQAKALESVRVVEEVHRIAGIDPAFTNGGDRTVVYFATVGLFEDGQYGIRFDDYEKLSDDSTDKTIPRSYQIARQIKQLCARRGIPPENVAVDATGAGSPFCDVLAGEWASGFLRVGFGGAPSDKRVAANSSSVASDLYKNRVSELWFVGKELLRTKQIRGVGEDLAKEMCSRRYDTVKEGSLKIRVETKDSLRARTGVSPDLADAAFLALEMARARFGLVAVEPPTKETVKTDSEGAFALFAGQTARSPIRSLRDLDIVSRTAHAHIDINA